MIVEIIPCLSDNYSYLIHERETGTISIVDPSEFNACDKIINKYKKLDFIFILIIMLIMLGLTLTLKKNITQKF